MALADGQCDREGRYSMYDEGLANVGHDGASDIVLIAPHGPSSRVMAGLVPAIHVDPRDKPGDDELHA